MSNATEQICSSCECEVDEVFADAAGDFFCRECISEHDCFLCEFPDCEYPIVGADELLIRDDSKDTYFCNVHTIDDVMEVGYNYCFSCEALVEEDVYKDVSNETYCLECVNASGRFICVEPTCEHPVVEENELMLQDDDRELYLCDVHTEDAIFELGYSYCHTCEHYTMDAVVEDENGDTHCEECLE